MTVRETYMKDYLITDCRKKELVQFCRNADNEDLIMILQAAIQSNSGLASKLFINIVQTYMSSFEKNIADVIELIDTEDITGYIPAEKTDRA